MRQKIALAAAVVALAAGGVATPAQAAPSAGDADRVKPTARVISVSKVYLVDGKPMVTGTYKCTGRLSHLWVSAKQGRGNLAQEGSGAMARSWYQRTWDNKVNCNGKRHTAIFRLRPTGDTGKMREGRRAWVQFCLLTANRPQDFEEGGNSSFASNMRYRRVRSL